MNDLIFFYYLICFIEKQNTLQDVTKIIYFIYASFGFRIEFNQF